MNKNFTSAIRVNKKTRTIEITKKFDKAAARFGTDEYNALQQVRKDYPDFIVVVKKTRSKKESFRGLSYDFMEKYISSHDDDKQTNMNEFNYLRGKSEEATKPAPYFKIKAWFISAYPEITGHSNHRVSGQNVA